MSRRLAELAEQSLEDAGGARAQKFAREAGFPEKLLQKLEDRIQASSFESEHAAALSQINLPVSYKRSAASPHSSTFLTLHFLSFSP
jgi:hypothetical protein